LFELPYIRSKKVKGIEYAYLVKSEWDPNTKSSRQQIIKYLGRASNVELGDVPEQYKQDPKILAFLSEHNPEDTAKANKMINGLQDRLFEFLSSGDVAASAKMYDNCRNVLSLEDFYDKVLKPVMYYVGSRWEKGLTDIATEHVCSNTAHALIVAINQKIQCIGNREKILLCTPEGEIHSLALNVIESILLARGYRVFNASPSVPANSLLDYIKDTEPNLIMISITLLENRGAGERLAYKITSKFSTPILIGGLAMVNVGESLDGGHVVSPIENSLEDVVRTVRSYLHGSKKSSR
jgi:methanogenic corrinoid protein MtbC1